MTSELRASPVRRENFAAGKMHWNGHNAFYGRCGDTALPSAVNEMTWARFSDSDEPLHAIVAERGGVLED